MARKSADSELGIHNVLDDIDSLPFQLNPFEAHRQGASGFDETEFKGLRELGYNQQIASRAILAVGGQIIDFDYLYQLDLVHLQRQLAQDYTKLCTEGRASNLLLQDIHEHLKDYSMILKNYEDMLCRTPKQVLPNWNLLDIFYPSLGLTKFKGKSGVPSAMHWMKSRTVRGYSGYSDFAEKQQDTILHLKQAQHQQIEKIQEKVNRFFVALFGGLAVVAPILVVCLNPSQTKSLVTVSVSVILVSLLVAVLSKASYQELLMATAAYAAILVVFVGSGGPSMGQFEG